MSLRNARIRRQAALVANLLCRKRQKHTICELGGEIRKSALAVASPLSHPKQSADERISMVNRRVLLTWLGVVGVCAPTFGNDLSENKTTETSGGWEKFPGNPVLGGQYGTCFDICVLHESAGFRMWLSWRPKKSVALSQSKDGVHW